MAWNISGEMWESCSCKMLCRCNFGPAEPDQEWCSAIFALDVREGSSEGVDLSGTRAIFAADLPGDFVGGNATSRIYIDEAASEDQRKELEAIFSGQKGGVWEAMAAGFVTKWVPATTASIKIADDRLSVDVYGLGQMRLQPVKTESGKQTKLVASPAAEAFGVGESDLHFAQGTKWSDPEMRTWESLGFGGKSQVSWSA